MPMVRYPSPVSLIRRSAIPTKEVNRRKSTVAPEDCPWGLTFLLFVYLDIGRGFMKKRLHTVSGNSLWRELKGNRRPRAPKHSFQSLEKVVNEL